MVKIFPNIQLSLVARPLYNLISDWLISLGGQDAREEIRCLICVVYHIWTATNQIKNNFLALTLCYLHPEIAKSFINFTTSEINELK